MKKIDILVGDNTYGTTLHFAKGLAAALKRRGIDTRLFWVSEGEFYHAFYTLLDDPPDLTCSFSDITVEGRPLSQMWTIPHLSMLVDPPIYFLHQLSSPRSWLSCVDQLDCAFVKQLDFPNVFFLPHGGDPTLLTPIAKERPYDIVFFGSCIDFENNLPETDREIILAASERVLSPEGISIAQALIELGIEHSDFARLHANVDQYTRGKDRVELLRSLQGHTIHIWGEGPWEKYLPHCVLHRPIAFDQTLEVMKQSKVVLNSSPRFKAGLHERIIYGHLCGAAVYSGATPYLIETFPSLFTYPFGEWENRSFDQWEESAAQGQQLTLAHHTWDARADTLLKTSDNICNTRPHSPYSLSNAADSTPY